MPTIENGGIEIHFEDDGQGPCVLLGHSFLCSGEMWRGQLPDLLRAHRVVNVDLRGHGRSGRIERAFSVEDMLSDMIAILDQLGVEEAVWGGLSTGGMIALRAALTFPQRTRGLILVDTHAGAESRLRRLEYRAMAMGVQMLGFGPFMSGIARKMFGMTTRRGNPALVEEWKGKFAALDIPSVSRFLAAIGRRRSLVHRLGEIAVPTLIVVGEEDIALPPACARELHAGIGGSELVVVPGAGHLSALEQPERVTEAMLSFLDAI
jgi:pimeloyl-ACP methyl ester carboxylesterase